MVDASGAPERSAKPKRRIRNYLLDRRFQLKYALLLSGASALLMAIMGTLLYTQMRDSEQRLDDERGRGHAAIMAETAAATAMLESEMRASAQQLVNRRITCEAAPRCDCPAAPPETVIERCDPNWCLEACASLGWKPPGGAAPPAPSPPPPPADPAAAPPPAAPGGPPADPAAAPASGAEQETGRAPEPSAVQEEETRRQLQLIEKITKEVQADADAQIASMKDRTQARLAALDADAQQRMDELRHANRRDLNAILISLVIIFVVLSLVGIVVTHKVVGPIYRMRMLVGRIDGDHLVLHGKLRHGDELQDLFEEVSAMLDRLRDHQQAEIGALEGLLKRLREAEGDAERMKVVAELEAFRARMAHALAPKPVDG